VTTEMRELVQAYTDPPTESPAIELALHETAVGWCWHADWIGEPPRDGPPAPHHGGPFRSVEVAVVDACAACPGFKMIRVA
jgi:hypothetical protein